jgi:hypothetical protein
LDENAAQERGISRDVLKKSSFSKRCFDALLRLEELNLSGQRCGRSAARVMVKGETQVALVAAA